MKTISMTPEETLLAAYGGVAHARDLVRTRQEDVKEAQEKADEAAGLTAAAQRDFDNAEARYRVLESSSEPLSEDQKKLAEKHGTLECKLDAAVAELARARSAQTAVVACRQALDRAIEAMERFTETTGKSVSTLRETAEKLDEAASAAPPGQKAVLRNACRTVGAQRSTLEEERTSLREAAGMARKDAGSIPGIDVSAEEAQVARLTAELKAVEAQQKAVPSPAPPPDLKKARADRDNAELALASAPGTEGTAQARLRSCQAELASARKSLSAAIAALEAAERQFVGSVQVTGPDATGWATAKAVMRRDLPDGFVLRWNAGGAPMDPVTGTGNPIRIDARTLPLGDTDIELCIERDNPK